MKQIQHTDGSVSFASDDPAPIMPDVSAVPSDLREAAYRADADQYLTAYTGYMLEGRTAEAEEQKALYLAAKAEIRERWPEADV